MKRSLYILILFTVIQNTFSQDKKISASVWDGVLIAGYCDDGAFVNFGGPSIKYIAKPMSIGFGVLPSMRIKEDNSTTVAKNSVVTPTLGFGLTFAYKHFALQVPFFYNPKTATTDGKWNPGFGI
ncbi:MAG: hypothetical protein H7221_03450, partial [Flavobacterium sp.]|nr:hypothetical protein [Flavobacterium sp.]